MKKLCAMLLSLCMILSPIVVVPAYEPVAESTPIEIAPMAWKPGIGLPAPTPKPKK